MFHLQKATTDEPLHLHWGGGRIGILCYGYAFQNTKLCLAQVASIREVQDFFSDQLLSYFVNVENVVNGSGPIFVGH